jgi:PAS domain S-box-containing protein
MSVDDRSAHRTRPAGAPVARLPIGHRAPPGGGASPRAAVVPWDGSQRPPEGDNHARLLHILDSVSDFVGVVGPDNRFTYLNAAGRAMLGIGDAAPIAGIRLPDLYPPAVAKRLEGEALPAAVRDGTWTGEATALTRSGREVAVMQTLIVRRAPDGRLDSVAVVMRDIRKRKRAQAALRHSEERFRMLADTTNDGFAVMDRHGVLVFVNERFAQILECSPSDVIGRALLDFVDSAQRESIALELEACGKDDRMSCDATLEAADGRRVDAFLTIRPIAASDAGAAGSCAIVTDLSASIRLRQTADQAQSELQSLARQVITAEEKERKRIAADLHDGLGQSLSALKFGVEHALCALGANAVDDAGRTLGSLLPKVKDALDELRRLAMNLRPSTLDDLGILATLSWFAREFQAIYRTIAVDLDIRVGEDDVPDELKVAMFRITQEAMNNVAKHAQATRITLRIDGVNDRLRLTVADNGVGFDPAVLAARPNIDRRRGLAGLRDRVRFSGGTLVIEAAPGAGVCLRMSWPRANTRKDPQTLKLLDA